MAAASVQLRLGDMFDGPSDMVVLPCSDAGTVAFMVREKLARYRLPMPKHDMRVGDVDIVPFEGGEHIAQYAAFAASVGGYSTSESLIRTIGERLGAATRRLDAVRLVAAPLLGTGAGGLDPEFSLRGLAEGWKTTAAPEATLLVSVLREPVFRRLAQALGETPEAPSPSEQSGAEATPTPKADGEPATGTKAHKPLRVFISYCHTSDEHRKWVLDFATFLRRNGIDARLDQWHLRAGMDMPSFMANELEMADRVILVTDEQYAQRANGQIGGVGWETMIVQGDLYRLPPTTTKYLIVVKGDDLEKAVPTFLRTRLAILWPDASVDGEQGTAVLRELYNVVMVPPIGPPPVWV